MSTPAGPVAPSISPVLVPNSLETQPPSPAVLNAASRPLAQAPLRAKAPVRTYGKRVAIEESVAAGGQADERDQGQSLERRSTVVIPETDPDDVEMDEGRNADRDEEEQTETNSSSPPPPKSDLHSTSPTSTEGEGDRERDDVAVKRPGILDGLSDSDSDDDEDAAEGGAIAYFDKHKSVAEMLAEVDREVDERDDSPPPQPAKAGSLVAPTSSSLPTLTDTDAISRDASSSRSTSPANPRHSSSSVQILGSQPGDDTETPDVLRPTARSKKARARILDSEDEEDEGTGTTAMRPAPAVSRHSVVPESSDHEGDVGSSSPVRGASTSATTVPSHDRLKALVEKKKAAAAAKAAKEKPRQEPIPAVEDVSSDDEQENAKTKKKGKSAAGKAKIKALSRKAEDEMNKQSAQFARAQDARIEPVTKSRMNVLDILRRDSSRQPSKAPTPAPQRSPEVVTITSSDSIVEASSSPSFLPAPTHQPTYHLSTRALGKRPESVIDSDTTPVPRRTLKLTAPALLAKRAKDNESSSSKPVPMEDDDEEDELLDLDEMLKKKERRKAEAERQEKERLEKRKRREEMIRAARAKAQEEDDESDLEIEGAPVLAPRPPPAPSRRTSSDSFKRAGSVRPGSELSHVMRDFAGVDPNHHHTSDDDPTESQLRAAGREFGRNLEPNHHVVPSPIGKTKRRATTKSKQIPQITHEDLANSLRQKFQRQAIASRAEKMSEHRRQQEQAGQGRAEPARVDVKGMMEQKKKQQAEEEQIEEDDDPDYQAEFDEDEEEAPLSNEDEDGDEMGSGSDAPRAAEDDGEADEGEVDSEGEPVMPPSSQNSDRLRHRDAARDNGDDDHDDDEDVEDAPISRKALPLKRCVVVDDDENAEAEDEEEANALRPGSTGSPMMATEVVKASKGSTPTAAPAKLNLGGFMDGGDDDGGGGFSQFFNSQFSQEVGGGNEEEGFGRTRAAEAPPAPTMFAAQPLISTAEQAADVALLEARGAVHNVNLGTPREAAAPRQYINKQGCAVSTAFAASQQFDFFHESLSTARDSQSQRVTQTQIDATPTQAYRAAKQLRRFGALVKDDSQVGAQPDATELADETQEESFPSAAQPASATPRDAFDMLRAGAAQQPKSLAPIPEKIKTRREPNAFIDTEAGLSDEEEMGMGAPSGDEDEEGHDAELEELVDNQEVDAELRSEQDKLALERYQEDAEKAEAAALSRAQNIAAGKERHKRRGFELDDDEFDDDYVRRERGEKKARVDTLTTAELHANEKTRPFAAQLTNTCTTIVKEGDYAFLDESQGQSDVEDDDEPIEMRDDDIFGGDAAPRYKVNSFHTIREEAVRRQREFEASAAEREEREAMMERQYDLSSSPVAAFKLNNRIAAAVNKPARPAPRQDDFDEIDSQYSLYKGESIHSVVNYKSTETREESQGGNGVAAGGRSAVTSFKRGGGPSRSTTSLSSTSSLTSAKSNARTALGPKASKFKSIRKEGSGFA
ncbi:hypothetical protein JCM10212_000187 [Sporobolomyces blumeae]